MPQGSAEKTKQAFAQVLRELRSEQGLSQEKLAERAGLYRTYPSLLERAERQPSLDVLLRLAEALRVSPEELMRRVAQQLGRA